MADNAAVYGFRWAQGYNTKAQPQPIEVAVASAQTFTVSGLGGTFNLNVGDLVSYTTTGTIIQCGGNENGQTSVAVYGVVVGFGGQGYYNGTRMVRSPFLPSAVTYGTNVDRQTKVLVVPASAGYWECDCDGVGSATASTYLTYQAFIGENCDHRNNGSTSLLTLNPQLNIASHAAATATLSWRIMGVSQNFSNQDYTGANVKMIVAVNKGQEPFYTNVGV
jgi:hypothetical protein